VKEKSGQQSDGRTQYLYFFRDDRTGSLFETQAVNSDRALLKCLRETKWKMELILYEGKEALPAQWESYFPD
jgi:hypothetical protein